jgi:hypothetical protein
MEKTAAVGSLLLFVVLLITVPVLAIFPLFLFVYTIQSRIQLNLTHFYWKYITLGLACGLFTEFLAVLDNLDSPLEERILFHPDPAVDLLLGVGFYFCIAVIWGILVKKYAFTEKSILVIGGIWGVIVEQDMAVLLSPLQVGVVGFLFYVFVFLVYGPFMAIPYVFFKKEFNQVERKERKFRHVVLAFVMLFVAYILAGLYMILVYSVFGFSQL